LTNGCKLRLVWSGEHRGHGTIAVTAKYK